MHSRRPFLPFLNVDSTCPIETSLCIFALGAFFLCYRHTFCAYFEKRQHTISTGNHTLWPYSHIYFITMSVSAARADLSQSVQHGQTPSAQMGVALHMLASITEEMNLLFVTPSASKHGTPDYELTGSILSYFLRIFALLDILAAVTRKLYGIGQRGYWHELETSNTEIDTAIAAIARHRFTVRLFPSYPCCLFLSSFILPSFCLL